MLTAYNHLFAHALSVARSIVRIYGTAVRRHDGTKVLPSVACTPWLCKYAE